jgi:hypothetical protein
MKNSFIENLIQLCKTQKIIFEDVNKSPAFERVTLNDSLITEFVGQMDWKNIRLNGLFLFKLRSINIH